MKTIIFINGLCVEIDTEHNKFECAPKDKVLTAIKNKKLEFTTKEDFLQYLKVTLKEKGFKKQNLTWKKNYGEITAVFNFQNSQFGKDSFYLNGSIIINEFKEDILTDVYGHIFDRFKYESTMKETLNNILMWFDKYSNIEKIKNEYKKEPKNSFIRERLDMFCLTNRNFKL